MAKRKKVRVRHRVRIRPRWLELARGHDGLLRGHPEPVFVAAAWMFDGEGRRPAAFLGRTVWRVPPIQGRFPLRLELAEPDAETKDAIVSHAVPGSGSRLAILVIALEEDDGAGVSVAYTTLGTPDPLRAWRADSRIPDPLSITALAATLDATDPFAAPVSLLTDHGDLSTRCAGDDWQAAALATRALTPKHRQDLRFHFVTDRNDWTLGIDLRTD